MKKVARRMIIPLILIGALAITSAFLIKSFALFSWLVALGAIIAASVILIRQPGK